MLITWQKHSKSKSNNNGNEAPKSKERKESIDEMTKFNENLQKCSNKEETQNTTLNLDNNLSLKAENSFADGDSVIFKFISAQKSQQQQTNVSNQPRALSLSKEEIKVFYRETLASMYLSHDVN